MAWPPLTLSGSDNLSASVIMRVWRNSLSACVFATYNSCSRLCLFFLFAHMLIVLYLQQCNERYITKLRPSTRREGSSIANHPSNGLIYEEVLIS